MMTTGLERVAQEWAAFDRSRDATGMHATFVHGNPQRTVSIAYDLDARTATFEAGPGRVIALSFTNDPTDVRTWVCTCPLATISTCLHTSLAARGLVETLEEPTTIGLEDPDPRFDVAMEASAGLTTAATRSNATVSREGEQLRILKAIVGRVGDHLVCDCPMGNDPVCLHRLIAVSWARGQRMKAPGQHTPITKSHGEVAHLVTATVRGEKLALEDVERFGPTLDRVDMLLSEILTFGLQRTTFVTLERLDTLAMAARALGVRDGAPRHTGLGRIARTLDRLRQILSEFQNRIVTTTELDVLRELAVLRNLSRAVRANTGALPLFDFAGATQQEYTEVGVMDVQGLGFEAWITPTGFAGVTALVMDLRNGRVLTRTNTLPADIAQDFASRGWDSTSWADQLASQAAFAGSSVTYLDLAKGRFLLSGAMVALDSGRLSGSGKTQLAKRSPLPLNDNKFRSNTILGPADSVRIASRLGFDPLGRSPSSPGVALLPVRAITLSRFERKSQRLGFSIETGGGMHFDCTLTYRDDRALWIDNLEKMARATTPPQFLLTRLRLDQNALIIEPLTAYFEKGGPKHLTYKVLDVELQPLRTMDSSEAIG